MVLLLLAVLQVSTTGIDASTLKVSPATTVAELDLGKLKGELRKGGTGAGSLGNFVTDGMRAQATLKTGKPVVLALMNAGGRDNLDP